MDAARLGIAPVLGAGIVVVAIDQYPGGASLLLAEVTICAGVAVVTWAVVGSELAARVRITRVGGAGIAVVAGDRFPGTQPIIAKVAQGAVIAVVAVVPSHVLMNAPHLRVTAVGGAGVVVFASLLVDLAVAIVINAVAILGRGGSCIASGQTGFTAIANPRTQAEVILAVARGREGQLDGLVDAGTDPGIVQALADGDPFKSFGFTATKAEGTVLVNRTGAAAKAPFFRIVDAAAFQTGGGETVVVGGARAAKPGEARNANPARVGAAHAHLFAKEPSRAFLDACLRADGVAHVIDAEAAQAI